MSNSKAFALCIIVLGLLILCIPFSPRPESSTTEAAEILAETWTLPIPVPLPSLNPQKVISATEKSLMLLVFSRLVKSGEQLQIEPDALEHWSYNLDRKRLTLSLRQGILFHDGVPLTTRDVIFSFHEWARAQSLDHEFLEIIKGVREYSAGKARRISGIHAVDDRTLTIDMSEWGSDQLIRNLSQARFCLYPENFRGKTREEFFQSPIGTGPFRLVSYQPKRVIYGANSSYHFGAPGVQSVVLLHLSSEAAVEAFRKHQVDNLIMYHLSDVSGFQAKDVLVKKLSRENTFAIIFNTIHPALRDIRFRRSLAAKIPKEELARLCFPGADIANGFIPPGIMGGTKEKHTPARGSRLIPIPANLELTFHTLEDENGDCTTRVLQKAFGDSPIRFEQNTFKELYQKLKAGTLHAWAESSEFKSDDPYENLRYFTSTSNEFLLGRPIAVLEGLFSKLMLGELSITERADIYRRMDRYLVDTSQIVPVLHFNNYVVYRPNIKNLEFLRTGRFSANWHKIKVLKAQNVAE